MGQLRIGVIAVCFFLGSTTSYAQEYPFVHYSTENEINPLPSASVRDLHQDSQLFMWFVVYSSGLVRYDGQSMEIYSSDDGLPGDGVFNIVEDKEGFLWVSTDTGLAVSEKRLRDYGPGQRLRFVQKIGGTTLVQKMVAENTLFTDPEGGVWMGTIDSIIGYRWEPDGTLREIKHSLNKIAHQKNTAITSLILDHGRTLWASLGEVDFLRVNVDGTEVRFWEAKNEAAGICKNILALLEIKQGQLVAGCRDGSIRTVRETESGSIDSEIILAPTNHPISKLVMTSEDEVLVSRLQGGGLRLSKKPGQEFKQGDFNIQRFSQQNGLPTEWVQAMLRDKERNLWFAHSAGVSKLRVNYEAFQSWTAESRGGGQPALPNAGVGAVTHTGKGDQRLVWVGTDGGISVMDVHGKSHILTKAAGVPIPMVWSICADGRGRVWFKDENRLGVFSTDATALPEGFPAYKKITILGDRTFYVSFIPFDLNRFSSASRWESPESTLDTLCLSGKQRITCWIDDARYDFGPKLGLPKARINSVQVGPKGYLWVGTSDQGLFKSTGDLAALMQAKKPSSNFKPIWNEKSGADSDHIQTLVWTGKSWWVGTAEGVSELHSGSLKVLSRFSEATGLPNKSVSSIDQSKITGHLWLGTNGGLAEIDPDAHKVVKTLSKSDGLIDNEVWFHQSVRLDDLGAVYFGTPKGLSVYRPQLDQKNEVLSLPKFREIRFDQDDSGNNELFVRFSALSFADEKSVRYRWRVAGYRSDWSKPTVSNELRLMNLPAFGFSRDYSVEILASNNDGVWSKKPIRFVFTVVPAWWLRWYMITLVLSSVFGTFVVFYRVRVAKIAQRARELKELSDNLQDEVEVRVRAQAELEAALGVAEEASRLKSEFLANVSHELRTPLNSIVNIPGPLLRDYHKVLVWNCPQCGAAFQDDGEPVPVPDFCVPDEIPDCPDCSSKLEPGGRCSYVGDPDEHAHFLGNIDKSGRHLLAVVNDLLDFSKLDAGHMKLVPVSVVVAELFDTVSTTTASLVLEKDLNISYEEEGDVELVADPVKLTQIIVNLVGNAIKFTPEQGSVAVVATKIREDESEMALFSVADTGIGIPKEDQDTIFDSFRQVDGSHTRLHQGTGLGLAITRKLVELHGGRIWVESKVGKGSTFYFQIPLRGPPLTPETEH